MIANEFICNKAVYITNFSDVNSCGLCFIFRCSFSCIRNVTCVSIRNEFAWRQYRVSQNCYHQVLETDEHHTRTEITRTLSARLCDYKLVLTDITVYDRDVSSVSWLRLYCRFNALRGGVGEYKIVYNLCNSNAIRLPRNTTRI